MSLLLFLSFCVLSFSFADTNWAALFLIGDDSEEFCAKFYRPNLPSSLVPYCEHLTLQFGGNLTGYELLMGTKVHIQPLVYGQDENGQAVLSMIIGDEIFSTNNITHITVSVSNIGPYTPVYSNYLWQRVINEASLYINRDWYDFSTVV